MRDCECIITSLVSKTYTTGIVISCDEITGSNIQNSMIGKQTGCLLNAHLSEDKSSDIWDYLNNVYRLSQFVLQVQVHPRFLMAISVEHESKFAALQYQ